MTRSVTALLALFACTVFIASCGGSGSSGDKGRPTSHKLDRDADNDNNDDDGKTLYYGHAASSADWQAVSALVIDYYHAAAAENGARGCADLFPPRAEAVAEDYGHVSYLRGTNCVTVLTKLFKYNHNELERKASVHVDLVRVQGDKALAMIGFTGLPAVRQIFARKVGTSWKLRELLDELVE